MKDARQNLIRLDDLDFKPHYHLPGARHAEISFANGYGVSIVKGVSWFEIAILKDNEICYDTELTNDVIKTSDLVEVDKILCAIQKLGKE